VHLRDSQGELYLQVFLIALVKEWLLPFPGTLGG